MTATWPLGINPMPKGFFLCARAFTLKHYPNPEKPTWSRLRPRLRWTTFRGQIARSGSDLSCFDISVREKNPAADVATSPSRNMKSEHLEAPHEPTLRS